MRSIFWDSFLFAVADSLFWFLFSLPSANSSMFLMAFKDILALFSLASEDTEPVFLFWTLLGFVDSSFLFWLSLGFDDSLFEC